MAARRRATKLKNLHLDEVSLVGNPANDGARVVLHKADDFASIRGAGEANDRLWRMVSALQDSFQSIVRDEDVADKGVMMSESLGQFSDAVSAWVAENYGRSQEQEDEMVDKMKHEDEDEVLDEDDKKKKKPVPPQFQKAIDDAVAKAVTDSKVVADKAAGDLRKANDAIADLTKSRDAATAALDLIRRNTAKAEKVALLRKSASHATVDLEKAADALLDMRPETATLFEAMLKSTSEIVAKAALLGEVGSSAGGGSVSTTADEVLRKANEMVAKGGASPVPLDIAIQKVLNDDPELSARYQAERRGRAS